MKRRLFLAYVLIFVVSAAVPAHAGKSPGGATSSKSSVKPARWWSPATLAASAAGGSNTGAAGWQDCLADGAPSAASPSAGDCIKFDFQTSYWDPTNGTGPWLQLQCFRAGQDYQYEGQLSGVIILADSRAGFPGGWGYEVPFVLAGTSWRLGPANCTIQVGHKSKNGRFTVDASTSFSVSG